MSVHADRKTGKRQRERIVLAVQDRRLGMTDGGRPVLVTQSGAEEKAVMAHRRECVCQRISRFQLEGTVQKDQRIRYLRRHSGINIRLRLQDEIVSVEAVRPLAFDSFNFGPAQVRLDRADHIQGNFVLQRKNVIERTIEALGPQMAATLRFNHLRGNADTAAVLPHASLQQVAHAQLAADALHVHRHPFVGEA